MEDGIVPETFFKDAKEMRESSEIIKLQKKKL